MDIQSIISLLHNVLINWPLFIIVIGVSVVCTVAFKCIQFRYLGYAFKQVFAPAKSETPRGNVDMTPMQAFINTLSTNIGSGSIGGTATAIVSGGPGAALWIIVFGLLLMAVRFAEVFLSLHYASTAPKNSVLGGPMLYLNNVIGGRYLTVLYGALCFIFGLVGGCTLQTNTITLSLVTTSHGMLTPVMCAVILLLFTVYIVYGGAARVAALSEAIVPIKVIAFFGATLAVLGYHYQSLGSAMALIVKGALTPEAVMGGALGFTVQSAIRYGMMRTIFATESGLGTSAILFGRTGSKEPVKDSIVAMLSTLISSIVCFTIALCIIASGVWNSGLNSVALTAASYSTVFGSFGNYVVTFLSIAFGAGVMVAYAYITKEAWLALTGGRFAIIFAILYCAAAVVGALCDVKLLWDGGDIPMAIMLVINLFGIVYLLPVIAKGVREFKA